MSQVERPLSPHLQVYRPQITSVLSIFHRVSGVMLGFGLVLLAWWLVAVAMGPDAYALASTFLWSWFGKLVLFGFTFGLYFHMCTGIRHLFWDAGRGFELEQVTRTGWAAIICAIGLTIITWALVLGAGGKA